MKRLKTGAPCGLQPGYSKADLDIAIDTVGRAGERVAVLTAAANKNTQTLVSRIAGINSDNVRISHCRHRTVGGPCRIN